MHCRPLSPGAVLMNTPPLPKDDQPDTYSGNWCKANITHLCADPLSGIYHLAISDGRLGSYCTRFNPRCCNRTTLATVPLNTIVKGKHLAVNQQRLAPCLDCVTMACVEAEMSGQSRYPLKQLLTQLAKLSDTTNTQTNTL